MSQKDETEGGQGGPTPSAATEDVTVNLPEGFLAPGQVLGDRYQIRSPLGRGGMGEVWRAFDLKLRVEVALKALREDLFKDEKHRDLLRREVRAAREVVSPNVCRIFDLIEAGGSELVSMEYVDGGTLLELLQERGPLDLKEAQDIASQFLAGLEAIHKAGLIHRDVKPENIMITRAGRVVLMDFGLARQEDTGSGTVAGTPAYMAPEQAAGQKVDARADVYAAGVVLAEMVSPEGIKSLDSRKSLWKGVRSEPAQLPDTPWAPVLKKAVAKEPDQRFNSAHTLTRALEDVTLRVEGADDLNPYPGLASFTEEDAEFFFGREAEIEQMWRKLEGAPRLLAVAGPSGAGKTSYLRAGLMANPPPGVAIVRCTPGSEPFHSIRDALIPEMSGDTEAMRELLRVEESDSVMSAVSRWKGRHDRAVLIVDQFEELFTLNPPEVQQQVAELLIRLVLEADAFVFLSLRDDFLFRCHQSEPLRPALSDLTMLGPPEGADLRRALVQPAVKCGYRFENDELVEEILAEVEGERGALPMLAFAMSRLWEKRDRENGLLTRQAYHDIGGVGGALALHAEETIDRIGAERIPVVRELFRNLVTPEGTRAVREVDELMSVFEESERAAAAATLHELINARLLTSYEVHGEDEQPTRRVEVIHESLLAAWPRLVRWQTQDADAAQLRDQLRQAARTWDEHERSDDMLWTGSPYREFASWRERYPGGLSDTEEAFAAAMTALVGRRRRRRRFAVGAALLVLAGVASVLGLMWAKSVKETRRAEASELLALGQLELDSYPSSAVAHTIASLELADRWGARLLAQEALWKGPTAFVVNDESSYAAKFSTGGRSLVQAGYDTGRLRLIHADGTSELLEHRHEQNRIAVRMGLETDHYLSGGVPGPSPIGLWSAADGRLLGEAWYDGDVSLVNWTISAGQQRGVLLMLEGEVASIDTLGFDGTHERLGNLKFGFGTKRGDWRRHVDLDRRGDQLGAVVDGEVVAIEIGEHGLSQPRRLGRHEGPVTFVRFDSMGRFFATVDGDGRIRLWDVTGASPPTVLQGPQKIWALDIPADGSLLAVHSEEEGNHKSRVWSLDTDPPRLLRPFDLGPEGLEVWRWDLIGRRVVKAGPDLKIRLWPMGAPADADPILLLRGEVGHLWGLSFHPQRCWLASADVTGVALWPLARQYPAVIRHHEQEVKDLVFGPEGSWLVSLAADDTVRLWPLEGELPIPGRVLVDAWGEYISGFARTTDGENLLVTFSWSGARLVSLSGEGSKTVPYIDGVLGVTIRADDRIAAGTVNYGTGDARVLVWDLASGKTLTELRPEGRTVLANQFTGDGQLLSSSEFGLRRWDLETGESELLYKGNIQSFAASEDGGRVIVIHRSGIESTASSRAVYLDLQTGLTIPLETHGTRVNSVALGPNNDMVVTGGMDGVVRVGPVSGEEPHLLFGHEHSVNALAVDPLGRWIASGGFDNSVRLWPIPDLSKPPLHTLPREQLIAKLKTLTNLRIVRDEESATGWKLTHDPFPGWETVPTW